MKSLSFKQNMYLLCGMGAFAALAVGFTGYRALVEENRLFGESVTLSAAQHNHGDLDMMHDALRADVMSAFLAASRSDKEISRETVLADFKEHAANMRESRDKNEALPLGDKIREELRASDAAVDRYIADTETIITLAFTDLSAAQLRQPAFDASFKLLEEKLGTIGDSLESAITSQHDAAVEQESYYQNLNLVIILLLTGAIVGVGYSIIRGLLRQLGGDPAYAAEAVNRVANGELEIRVERDPTASHSLLAAIDNMRQKLKTNIDEITAAAEQTRKIAEESSRVKQALDVCDTSALITDTNGEVLYTNQAAQKLFSRIGSTLSQHVTGFNSSRLIGWNVNTLLESRGGGVRGLREARKVRVEIGGLTLDTSATPILGDDRSIMAYVIEWQDITDQLAIQMAEHRIAQENARVKQALDNVSSNTMIADPNGNIVYVNTAVTEMLSNAESDLRKALPNFNARQLIGANFDSFHKNPSHQRNLLANLTGSYRSQIQVAGRTFLLIANPILNEKNERIGSVVEWSDRTQEVAIENELNSLIAAANDGDLSNRIDLANKQGFFRTLSEGLNGLVALADDVISNTSRVMDALANGRLTERIDANYKGMFDKLKQDTNTTVDRLVSVVEQINDSARAVASGAQEIAQGNTDLSQRTEEQASSLEETASSMEEMTSTVRQSSESAKNANTLALESRERAVRGGEVVARAVSAMGAISASSKKIADIISVIDEIAFQTNLLALNAAVEAARAGEQGRGFAVVAGEVRSLAQRSASAAKEIKDLIRDSVAKVQDGTQLVNESGDTLKDLVVSVQKVSHMVQEIATAAVEQTAGIEQVNTAVSQMDEMTQQNAALVEEASAAGEALSEQARNLLDLIGFFDLGNNVSQRTTGTIGMSQKPRNAGVSQRKAAPTARAAPRPAARPTVMDEDDGDQWQEF